MDRADEYLVFSHISTFIALFSSKLFQLTSMHRPMTINKMAKIFPNKHFYRTDTTTKYMDSLETIFSIQKELASMIDLSRYPGSIDGRVSALSTAIVHEAIELQRLTSWKWWKKPSPFDTEAAKEELIDIWHFVVQASIELGMTPDDVVSEYQKKNRINRERQTSGY